MNHSSPFYERTSILIGEQGLNKLASKHVLIVGLGGVGGAATEAMGRIGVGKLTLLDHDVVGLSNLNRQLITLQNNIGEKKTAVAAARIASINPDTTVEIHDGFIHPDNVAELLAGLKPDYVLDCIDSVVCKAALVYACQQAGIPVVTALGAGGRIDVSKVQITTLNKTETCGLARALRGRLRKLGGNLKYPVVFSSEPAVNALPHEPIPGDPDARPRATNGTISYLPNIFGFMTAGFAIQQMLQEDDC
ncbi:MAG: tRNA threonylcarbamoyladenosine dehydratase [Zetaproteobacteria bacterium CG2_30_46_52]|nr:MAG: tRNA threonylcarbamoyladenosine dehydratase [Zetaproteobacteria bacterium CG2_30_46_52]